MLSRSEILKAIDKYYILAHRNFLMTKEAALNVKSPVYDKITEDIYDNLSNEDFANLFTKYLENYERFVNSLNIDPKQFGKILLGTTETEDDNFADLYQPLNESYQDLISSPYLLELPDAESWEESVDPTEVRSGIEALAKDANDRLAAAGKKAGNWSLSDVLGFLETRRGEMNREIEGRGDAGIGEGMSDKEIEYRGRKIEKERQYKKTYDKRVYESVGIGRPALEAQISDLQKAITTETNGIKREELQTRLKKLTDRLKLLSTYETQQENKKIKINMNPALRARYLELKKQRNNAYSKYKTDMTNLIKSLAGKPTNEQARIKAEMVRLKKQQMIAKKPSLDFDSPEIANNPKIIADLDPNNIIKHFMSREAIDENRKTEQLTHRRKEKGEGTLLGLAIKYRENINGLPGDISKSLKRKFATAPELKPYIDALEAAKKTGSPADVEAADKALATAGKQFILNHPLTIQVVKNVAIMRAWKDKIEDLAKQGILDQQPVSDEVKMLVQPLIEEGKYLIKTFAANESATQKATDIVNFLQKAIS